jgi:NADPH:quinone reductase-like Zn-dependent oxidoreductase
MKTVRFAKSEEPPQVLAVEERPVPEPGPGEVRVRILASPVNPSDLLFVRGLYAGVHPHFPAPVGFEGVAVVDTLGPRVHSPQAGQRVVVLNGQGGSWADYAVLPANSLIPVPMIFPISRLPASSSTRHQRFSCCAVCSPFLRASGCSSQLPMANWDDHPTGQA